MTKEDTFLNVAKHEITIFLTSLQKGSEPKTFLALLTTLN